MLRQVLALKDVPIASAAAGTNTSFALTRNGTMWSWGTGLALGHGVDDDYHRQLLPKVIEGLPAGTRIRRFAAGGYSVVCKLGDDSLWSWGKIADERSVPSSLALG